MDPYVKVSIGGEVQRTPVKQHSLNPVWNERLFFRVPDHDLSLPIQICVFDSDTITRDDYVGGVEITLATLAERAANKDLNTGLHPVDLPTMLEFELPLTPSTKPGRVYKTIPTITFR